jgi:hypothetical protein
MEVAADTRKQLDLLQPTGTDIDDWKVALVVDGRETVFTATKLQVTSLRY